MTRSGGTARRQVALTFDAESGSEFPDRSCGAQGWDDVLTLLGREGVTATFFMQGDWVAAHPDLARRTRDDGHLLGNHTLNHLDLGRHPTRTEEQVVMADDVIHSVIGHSVRPWLRLPYLSGSDDPIVQDVLAERGWEHIGTNADSRDWDSAISAHAAAQRVLAGAAHEGPVIAMFHTWPRSTVAAVRSVIRALTRERATFVPVSELSEIERTTVTASRRPGAGI